MYPLKRNRRLRTTAALRELVSESALSVSDLLAPLFLIEGINIKESVDSMPGVYRYSVDLALKKAKKLYDMGIPGILLFAKIDQKLKDNSGESALNEDGLMQKAIRQIKKNIPNLILCADLALDPYSIYGHDGIVENEKIINDRTNNVLAEIALSYAKNGADIIAPSDMMDGRVYCIRKILEKNNFVDTVIMSYSVKFASSFYSPFRNVLDSNPSFGDKKTYQMDFRNKKEGINEALQDIEEGADIIMVKPGLPYLDIVNELANKTNVPIAVYQVSGEYSMIKSAEKMGWINYKNVVMEQLMSFKRAGASIIITYFAEEAVKFLKKNE